MTKLIVRDRGVRVVPTASGGVRAASGDRSKAALDALRITGSTGMTAVELAATLDVDVKNLRTLLYRARDRGECSFVGTRWYAKGWSPGVAPDGLLPVDPTAGDFTMEHAADGTQVITPHPAGGEPPDDPDSEVWVDPLHRLD
jgi:hypothetical protein